MAHTPGPWTVQEGEVTAAEGDVIIAEMVGRGRPCAVENPIEAEANARLIAAAPDLLAALRLIVEHSGDPLKVAMAAIAKAEPASLSRRNRDGM